MSKQNKHKILLIVTYFGSWPKWMPAFLLSCKHNYDVDWLFITDFKLPTPPISNIKFVKMSLPEFNLLASDKLGLKIKKSVYSQVDLRPAYGVIFQGYIENYDFWGHCDIDVIWGRIRNFITNDILEDFQIISSRKLETAGHFTLYKNEARINHLFFEIPDYEKYFTNENHFKFDEKIISDYLKKPNKANEFDFKIYWSRKIVIGWPQLKAKPHGWHWSDGKILDKDEVENFYIHFMKWKSSINNINFSTNDEINDFYITRYGIWHQRIPLSKYIPIMIQTKVNAIPQLVYKGILHVKRKISQRVLY